MPHEWSECQGSTEVANLRHEQERQDGRLAQAENCIVKLKVKAAEWEGAVGMLRWILGFVGFSTILGIVGLLVQVL